MTVRVTKKPDRELIVMGENAAMLVVNESYDQCHSKKMKRLPKEAI